MTRPPTPIRAIWAVAILAGLTACGPASDPDISTSAASIPSFESARIAPPPGVNPDGCWVKDVSPAEIRTITRQIEVAPAQIAPDGTVIAPARFQTETAQEIVKEREELIFETPCPSALTPDFIASVQRALEARGLYRGPITGQIDVPTVRAIRRYQSRNGLPSGLLSMQSARRLGLLAVPLNEL